MRQRLYPAPGRLVRLPDGRPIPPAGREVPLDGWARRRLKDGDLLTAPPEAAEQAAEPEAGARRAPRRNG